MNPTCDVCGGAVNQEIADAVADAPGGPHCRACLKSFENNPQLRSLYEQIEEALSPANAAQWTDLGASDKLTFAIMQIEEGNIEGGSYGFHDELKNYAAYMVHTSPPGQSR